jgi:hypothetical protein
VLFNLSRRAAEFFVDALEADGAPEWMDLAAEIREHWGMSPWPAGSVRQPDGAADNTNPKQE